MKYETICFDFDSTLISGEVFDLLTEAALEHKTDTDAISTRVREITNKGITGIISYEDAQAQKFKLLGLSEVHVESVTRQVSAMVSLSVIDEREWFHQNADRIYVFSHNFMECMYPVTDMLGIERSHVFGNVPLYAGTKQGTRTLVGIDPNIPMARMNGKARQIEKLKLKRPSVLIGDGYADLEVRELGLVDCFVCYTAHEERDLVMQKSDSIAQNMTQVKKIIGG
jgi:D-3-phosphoglycerate dehydrogenase